MTAPLPNTSSKPYLSKNPMDMNRCFYRKALLLGKYAFNVHFLVFTVHFFILNVHFSGSNVTFFFIQVSLYMKISIMKFIFLVQKQIPEERFQILCCFVDTFEGSYSLHEQVHFEIPRIFRKNIIVCREAQCSQILDEEHGRCSRISFAENMDLP